MRFLIPLFILLAVSCKKKPTSQPILKAITFFSFKASDNPSLTSDVNGLIEGDTIKINLSSTVSLNSLVPTISFQGVSISPTSGVAQNFNNPVHYTVTANNGSTRTYVVNVRSLSVSKEITSFVFRVADNPGIVSDIQATISNDTIFVNTMLANGIMTVQHTGVNISPASGTQISLNNPTSFIVTAADGSTRTYTLIVRRNVYMFFGSADTYIYCLDATTGRLRWKYKTGGNVSGSAAIYDGKVYMGSNDASTYCLNMNTGALVWQKTFNSNINTSPYVENGVVYVSTSAYGFPAATISALNANTGTVIWQAVQGIFNNTSPTVSGNLVYVGGLQSGAYAVNKSNGALAWKQTNTGIVHAGAAVHNGLLYTGSEGAKLMVLDATTGAVVKSYQSGQIGSSNEVTIDNNTAYVSAGTQLIALDISTLTPKWVYNSVSNGLNGLGFFSAPLVHDGFVLSGTNEGRIYAINTSDGTLKWTTNSPIVSGLGAANVTAASQLAYAGSANGTMYCYEVASGQVKWTFTAGGAVYSGPVITLADNSVSYPSASGHRN